jgi:prophage regulatory protein
MTFSLQKLIKLPEVINLTGKSRSSIYAAIRDGAFPAPKKIGARAVAWTTESIRNWQESCSESGMTYSNQ